LHISRLPPPIEFQLRPPNLYLGPWSPIVTDPSLVSLHNLLFTFNNSSNAFITIAIPLALLNLTLNPPLVKTPTPYFPCRPYIPKLPGGTVSRSAQYYLGHAFLQGAFIGQIWDTGSYFLAQAPGPSLPQSWAVIIEPNDIAISATIDAPVWEDTWKNILSKDGIGQANSFSSQNSSPHTSASTATNSGPGSASILSRKAEAGIGIACAIFGLAAILIAVAWVQRRRSQRRNVQGFGQKNSGEAWKKPELGADTPVLIGETEGSGHLHKLGTEIGLR